MPASNLPEQMRINAIRSRWALFMLAWILNTNAEKPGSNGSTTPVSVFLGSGAVVIERKCFKKVSTPKLVSAEPKNTGDSSPALTSSWSNSSLAPSKSSMSSISFSRLACPIRSSALSDAASKVSLATSFWPPMAAVNVVICFFSLS